MTVLLSAAKNNLKVYTIIPNISGHLGKWPELLGKVKEMGFDTVHFLPLTEQGPSQSPYAVSHPLLLDARLRDPRTDSRDPGQLVKLLKEAGLSGCVDMVFNHVAPDGYMARNFPQWIKRRPDGAFMHAQYQWYDEIREWGDLVLLDYEHPDERIRRELWSFMLKYAELWADISGKTGGMIRLDNLHSGNPSFLKLALERLREKYDIPSIAELFASQDRKDHLTNHLGIDYFLATQWEGDHKFVPGLRRYLDSLHRTGGTGFFFPISTHDSGTPAQEYGCMSSTIPRYAVSALLSMGATGIVQRVEYGQQEKIPFIGGPALTDPGRHADFRDFLRTINEMGRKSVFYQRGNVRFVDNGHDAVIAGYRENGHPEEKFLVVANFDTASGHHLTVRPRDHGIPFDQRLMPLLEGCDGAGETLDFHLPPCGTAVIQLHPAGYRATACAFDWENRRALTSQSVH